MQQLSLLLRPSQCAVVFAVLLACNPGQSEGDGADDAGSGESGSGSVDCTEILSDDPCDVEGVLCPTIKFELSPAEASMRPSVVRNGDELSVALVAPQASHDSWYLFRDLSSVPTPTEVPQLPGANHPSAAGAFDLDADGVDDLVLADLTSLQVYPGATGEPVTVPHAGEGSDAALAVGDFDEDGTDDLALVFGEGVESTVTLQVFPGPDLTTAIPIESQVRAARRISEADPITVGDFDGDGHQDLAYASSSTPLPAHVTYGTGDGHFEAGEDLPDSGAPPIFLATLPGEPADVLIHSGVGTLRELRLDGGRGTWIETDHTLPWGLLSSEGASSPCEPAEFNSGTLQVGEWTGDATPDVILVELQYPDACGAVQNRPVLHLFEGTGSGTFEHRETRDLGLEAAFLCMGMFARALEPGRLYLQADAYGYVFEL